MSIRPLLLKNGIITPTRSAADIEELKTTLGIGTSNFVDTSSNQTINGIKTFSGSLRLPSSEGSLAGHVWRNGDALNYRDGANVTKVLLNSAGNLSNLMDKQASLNNLVGAQTANRVLRSNGTNVTLSQIALDTDIIINVLPIANGGTGSNTQNFVDLTSVQTIAGSKTFTSSMTIRGDVGIMNLFGNTDNYNTFRFTGNTNTAASYWDMGVMPSNLNRDFYIGSGWAGTGGQIVLRLNATNGNLTALGAIITSNTTATTSTTTGSIRAAGGGAFGGTIAAVLPTSPTGLGAGCFWRNGNVVNIV